MLKWLGRLLLALLLSLLVGLAIGTWLRLRLERPVYYIGAADTRGLDPSRQGDVSIAVGMVEHRHDRPPA